MRSHRDDSNFQIHFLDETKNDYFGASASYEHAITAKIEGILVYLTKGLVVQ